MRFRKLRIAWSAFWGLAAVLLVVLWVRSYWRRDASCYGGLPYANSARILESNCGKLHLSNMSSTFPADTGRWLFTSKSWPKRPTVSRYSFAGIGYTPPPYPGVTIPDWILASLIAATSIGTWIRQLKCQFSLRTLLIATTLVAMMLGLAVWAARN
jgi:hypothetical protein